MCLDRSVLERFFLALSPGYFFYLIFYIFQYGFSLSFPRNIPLIFFDSILSLVFCSFLNTNEQFVAVDPAGVCRLRNP